MILKKSKTKNNIGNKILLNEKFIFYITSLIFGLILCFARMMGDDIGSMRFENGTIGDYWNQAVDFYGYWSSRIFVNFLIFLFTDKANKLWPVFMGVSMFIMLNALSILFVDKHKKECNLFIACLVMLFVFSTPSGAGWISTSGTYFCPIAFGLMALVPIKKMIRGYHFAKWEYGIYILCLIYGANNEQMMVVILGCYFATVLYLLLHKIIKPYSLILLITSIMSCLLVLKCPGNSVRAESDMRYFPTFKMLNIVDRMELAYSTTMSWFLYGGHMLVIFIFFIMTILIWNRYKDAFYRMLSIIPVLITVMFGPLKDITFSLFPSIENLSTPISYYGLVTVENKGSIGVFIQFMVMGIIICIVCIEVFLLQYNIKEVLAGIIFLGLGLISRIAMGFTPTIYPERARTYAVLCICFVSVVTRLYACNVENLGGGGDYLFGQCYKVCLKHVY